MQHWRRLLSSIGPVVTLDYPYMVAGARRPDPLPVMIAAHAEALDRLRKSHEGAVVLIGKSMGSRVGCHLSLQAKGSALVCLGYPLSTAGDAPNFGIRCCGS